jgi:membrane-bound metal-dependent hydrolase YbcI (DUF457 family)
MLYAKKRDSVSFVVTGKSHMAANAFIGLALGLDPGALGGAVVAARLPDQLEFFMPWVKHRTVTHYAFIWGLGALILAAVPAAIWCPGCPPWGGGVAFGVVFGGFLHVLMDMFSKSGIPVWPGNILAAKAYRTGAGSEYLFLGAVCLLCSVAVWFRNPEFFAEAHDFLSKLAG